MLNSDFRDMLCALFEKKVEFLLVGAYAVSAHGYPRATGDMDIWIRCSNENAERMWQALKRFGAPLLDLTQADLATPGIVFQIGVVPRRIDILTAIDGVDFDSAWPRRVEVAVENLRVPVLSRTDLLVNKRAAGRPKDLADAAWLEANE